MALWTISCCKRISQSKTNTNKNKKQNNRMDSLPTEVLPHLGHCSASKEIWLIDRKNPTQPLPELPTQFVRQLNFQNFKCKCQVQLTLLCSWSSSLLLCWWCWCLLLLLVGGGGGWWRWCWLLLLLVVVLLVCGVVIVAAHYRMFNHKKWTEHHQQENNNNNNNNINNIYPWSHAVLIWQRWRVSTIQS